MIGFPKTRTDFTKYKPAFSLEKSWQNCFEKQTQFYLENQNFFSKKTEGWKFFPFPKVMGQDFVFSRSEASLIKKESSPCFPSSLFISVKNGKAFPLFKQTEDLFVYSWKEFLLGKAKLDSGIKEKIFLALQKQRNPFCSLNNVLCADGLILVIRRHLKQPLEIHYTQSDTNDKQGINLRNFIFLEKQTSAQILEIFYGREENKSLFFNIQTDCFVGEKAKLEHSRVDKTGSQDVFVNQLFAKLSKEVKACFFSLSLNAEISRYHSKLKQAEKSVSEVRGLSLLEGNKHSDHNVAVKHKGIEGISRQLYKSFLFDSAKQIFQGFVSIEKEAQKSDSNQLSQNFLFGERAFAVAFPELDISADDVKAGHGATVSPFTENKELIFYLQSRGIDSLQAFHLVLSALMEDLLSCLLPDTKKVLKDFLNTKLNSLGSKSLKI